MAMQRFHWVSQVQRFVSWAIHRRRLEPGNARCTSAMTASHALAAGSLSLRSKHAMVAQHVVYTAKHFTGSRPGAYSVNKQISLGRSIGAPQCSSHNPEIWPPLMQFSIRHRSLSSRAFVSKRCAIIECYLTLNVAFIRTCARSGVGNSSSDVNFLKGASALSANPWASATASSSQRPSLLGLAVAPRR